LVSFYKENKWLCGYGFIDNNECHIKKLTCIRIFNDKNKLITLVIIFALTYGFRCNGVNKGNGTINIKLTRGHFSAS